MTSRGTLLAGYRSQGAGHRVCTAENGLEAIDAVRSFNLIWFYGCQDAVDGGLEALGIIKSLAPETDVIIMTAYGS